MTVRVLTNEEYGEALELARKVFSEYEAPEYSQQGVDSFCAAIRDREYIAQLRVYGAYDGRTLIGMLATRSGGAHIALFFVDGRRHRQGVGRRLFELACKDNVCGKLTVNSSPYAVEVYKRLGFRQTDAEQLKDGIRYTPMECVLRESNYPCARARCRRHGDCAACREHHKAKKNPVACERGI